MSDNQDHDNVSASANRVVGDPCCSNSVVMWRYRKVILAGAAVGLALTIAMGFLLPAYSFTSLEFRVLFDGADAGKYPSGMRFGHNDIIANSILNQVYQANKLDKYGRFSSFQQMFFILAKPSAEVAKLDAEYTSKLTDRTLTAVDRALLEGEYEEKRSGLLGGVTHTLNMDLLQGFAAKMSPTLREKVLVEILDKWADDAALRKGAMKYQITIPTRNIIPEGFIKDGKLTAEPIIAADMLRKKLVLMRGTVREMQDLPGAKSFRTADKALSLGEIEQSLLDILNYRLSPSIELILTAGLVKDTKRAETYVNSALHEVNLAKDESDSRVKILENALAAYQKGRAAEASNVGGSDSATGQVTSAAPAVIPQLSASFLDQIVKMSLENNDMEFRQEYTNRIASEALKDVSLNSEIKTYSDMQKVIGQDKPIANSDVETFGQVSQCITGVYQELIDKTADIEQVYNELSEMNLNPKTELIYAAEPAFTRTELAVSIRRMVLYAILLTFGMALIFMAGCSLHARIKGRTAT